MTLILTAVCDDFIVQVSDRRFVGQHGSFEAPMSDEADKQVFVNATGFLLVAGFAGLAREQGEKVSTGSWLAETIGKPDVLKRGFDGCVDAARDAADIRMEDLYGRLGRRSQLSLVFAGFREGSPAPMIATVSNCKSSAFRVVELAAKFDVARSAMTGRKYWAEGVTAALPADTPQRMGTVLKAGDVPAVIDVAVDQIRKATRHGNRRGFAGVPPGQLFADARQVCR